MWLIPAIDLKNNQVVRLFQGDFSKTTIYGTDPLEYALFFEKEGAKRLHLVDLDGAKEGFPVHKEIIIRIAQTLTIPVQVGGGIREEKTIKLYLSSGISQVIVGTKAIEDLNWLKKLSNLYPEKIIVSVDVRGEKVATMGWLRTSELFYLDLIKILNDYPLFAIILTLVERDGTQRGVETERLEKTLQVSQKPIFFAGGVSTTEDLLKLKTYEKRGLKGVIVGKALYEGTLNLKEAFKVLSS